MRISFRAQCLSDTKSLTSYRWYMFACAFDLTSPKPEVARCCLQPELFCCLLLPKRTNHTHGCTPSPLWSSQVAHACRHLGKVGLPTCNPCYAKDSKPHCDRSQLQTPSAQAKTLRHDEANVDKHAKAEKSVKVPAFLATLVVSTGNEWRTVKNSPLRMTPSKNMGCSLPRQRS